MVMVFRIIIYYLVNDTIDQKVESAIAEVKLSGLFKKIESLKE
jgi:hypothetical protein